MKHISIFFLMISFQCAGQNVGVGTNTPNGKLEVKSNSNARPNILITDSAYKGFGSLRFNHVDYPGKYIQLSGYKATTPTAETYMSFASDTAQILGLRGNGNVSVNGAGAAYPLNVAGDVDISYDGALRMNGNSGTAGQVLSSRGEGQPSAWANQAFTEKIRFYFQGSSGATTATDSLLFNSTVYNLSPANIVKTNKQITINKTGLYHFEFFYNSGVYYSTQTYPPQVTLQMRMSSTIERAYFCVGQPYTLSGPNTPTDLWRINLHESKDIYLTAGTTIAVQRTNISVAAGSIVEHFFILSGYLISE